MNAEKAYAALSQEMLATDVAYYLVRKGVPFREAHSLAGKVVQLAETSKCAMSDLALDKLKFLSPQFDSDVKNLWDYNHSAEQYVSDGGTSRAAVSRQIQKLKTELGLD